MKVTLLSHTPNPEKVVACAAKLCYASVSADELYDGLTQEKSAEFVELLASYGHESPIEHVSFTFTIQGVSRALLAQITRHRIASFSVQSQRYVRKDKLEVIIPPEIEACPEAKAVFERSMAQDLEAYQELAGILSERHREALLAQGIPEKKAASMAEKKALEDARFVLPNACDTQMVVTMNARSLLNFFRHRCCNRAQWEIKAVADEMLRQACEVAPTLFASAGPACYKGACPEGRMSCGQASEMRQAYTQLHEKARAAYSRGEGQEV